MIPKGTWSCYLAIFSRLSNNVTMSLHLTSHYLLFSTLFVHCSFYAGYKEKQNWIKKFGLILDCDSQVMEYW